MMDDIVTMESAKANPADERPKPRWWESNGKIFLIGIGLGVCMIVADNYGYGGPFQWGIAFAAGTGVAVAAFWNRRSRPWFWPAVVFLILAHVIALISHRWHVLPHETGYVIAFKGAAGMDFAVSGFILWSLHQIFDPHTGIKSHWNATAVSITAVFFIIFTGIFAFVGVAIVKSHNEKIAMQKTVFSKQTTQSLYDIMNCMNPAQSRNDEWDDIGGPTRGKKIFDDARGQTTRIIDEGKFREVQMATVNGRPLRSEDQKILSQCVG